jgi:hypothetical protein
MLHYSVPAADLEVLTMGSLPTVEQMEAKLQKLRGVFAVRVVIEDDSIQEIHILASKERPVKQLVRDVEAMCEAEFRIHLDHRKVSVAQTDVPESHQEQLDRPHLMGVRQESTGEHATVAVEVAVGAQVYVGEASGIGANAMRPRLAAQATICALEQCLQSAYCLELRDLTQFNLVGRHGYTAVLSLFGKLGEEKLIGCALSDNDMPETCVRAVLDAINRRWSQLSVENNDHSGVGVEKTQSEVG